MNKKIVAVTACAAGIAHTYMAAESLEKAAKKAGYKIKVETQGSIGAENVLTEKDIETADVVIIAADINIDLMRFSGKRVLSVKSIDAIKAPEALIKRAYDEAKVFGAKGTKVGKVTLGKTENNFVKHIMSGISYMTPMVIASGILLAIANIFAFQANELGQIVNWGFDTSTQMGFFMSKLFEVGQVGFKLMIPLFAAFVANSIADKPAIAPAMIGAYLVNDATYLGTQTGGGFLGAILVAFIVGYLVKGLKKIKWPKILQPLLAIMIIPLIATFAIMVIVTYLIGNPIAGLMDSLYSGLTTLNETFAGAPFIIGAIIGGMIGFDFGGPVNKTALIFGTAVYTDTVAKFGIANANFVPQTATQAAISVAPLGIWLASVLFKNKFTKNEKISASSAFGMGMVGVTEGAIPFAASNPVQMITASVAGSALAGGLASITGCKFYGGIGSPLGAVIGYIEQPVPFITWILCIFAGILVTALIIGFWRKPVSEEEEEYIEVEPNEIIEESIVEAKELFSEDHIYIDENSTTQDEAFKFIASIAKKHGYVKSEEDFYHGLQKREKEATTGFNDGIAIPHSKNSTVISPGVFLIKFKNPIEWDSLDGKKITTAFALTIPEDGAENHLKILSTIAKELIDDDFRNTVIKETDSQKLYNLVKGIQL
ncbi:MULTISPECIES: fructose-specific PTS transporter subunit EIIC [Clostridium]|uniref:fructose-specific PTS transporter subunit EIIC n=1 Tax=Clostridium TaxID=1485 RepID=UPI0004221279|nr:MULTISPECIES: fructose-specific PTS transporter subunit EIIC [Clostridium]MDB2102298.1 fructose-specific PTS transporter subunit EIIC [Clostridium paraputrificum]MDB2108952.1 fructose-specific PTS transporter subunit EIIC [Clostridium paraputrificum]MDC0802250.1 fructose-specific PTS transporter subunit EIIC [Clostridium paraputrificum]MDU1309804.1 fructose-specific PTS transporter subunit EIIC [Clostridium sp.]MDU1408103.1 fructose-specific PTS transporter subunit EIIC [Clostridium sp.]